MRVAISIILLTVLYFPISKPRYIHNHRVKRQFLLSKRNPLLDPRVNPVGVDPMLFQNGVFTPSGGIQNPASAQVAIGGGTDVGGSLSIAGVKLLDGEIFAQDTGINVGSDGYKDVDSFGVLGTDVFTNTQGASFGPGGFSSNDNIGIAGSSVFSSSDGISVSPDGVSSNSGIGVGGLPIYNTGSGVSLGPGGLSTGDSVGVLGTDVYSNTDNVDLGPDGVSVGESIKAGPFDFDTSTGVGPDRVSKNTGIGLLGFDLFNQTEGVGYGPGGVSVDDGIGILGREVYSSNQGVDFGPGGVGTHDNVGIAGVPLYGKTSGVNFGPGGVGINEGTDILGHNLYSSNSGVGLGPDGVNIGRSVNAGPLDISSGIGVGPGGVSSKDGIGLFGDDLYYSNSGVEFGPGGVNVGRSVNAGPIGLSSGIGIGTGGTTTGEVGNKQNPPIRQAPILPTNEKQFNLLGDGYNNPRFYGFDWDGHGGVTDSINNPIFGRRVDPYIASPYVKPQTMSEWEYARFGNRKPQSRSFSTNTGPTPLPELKPDRPIAGVPFIG